MQERSYTVSVSETLPEWSEQRVKGGRASSDLERLLMFAIVLVFCGALVTGVVGSTLYVVKSNANVRRHPPPPYHYIQYGCLARLTHPTSPHSYYSHLPSPQPLFILSTLLPCVTSSLSHYNTQANLRVTKCEVLGMFLIPLRCGAEVCDKTVDNQQKCSIQIGDCYAPQWRVGYAQVDSEGEIMPHKTVNSWINDSPFKNQTEAEAKMQTHKTLSKATCTYDSKDPNFVTWGYDDPEPWLIAMIVSWCIVGLFVCALGFGWFFQRETGI